MKTKEELNALKEEVKVLNKKLAELTEEELAQVVGGQTEINSQISAICFGISDYLRGLLNPDWAYQSTLYRKDPNPLGDVT